LSAPQEASSHAAATMIHVEINRFMYRNKRMNAGFIVSERRKTKCRFHEMDFGMGVKKVLFGSAYIGFGVFQIRFVF
jgi:hypothetical protein